MNEEGTEKVISCGCIVLFFAVIIAGIISEKVFDVIIIDKILIGICCLGILMGIIVLIALEIEFIKEKFEK